MLLIGRAAFAVSGLCWRATREQGLIKAEGWTAKAVRPFPFSVARLAPRRRTTLPKAPKNPIAIGAVQHFPSTKRKRPILYRGRKGNYAWYLLYALYGLGQRISAPANHWHNLARSVSKFGRFSRSALR